MTLKLVVTTNVNGDVFELVLKNARYGVGRRHDNDLRIKETYISGYHAELVRQENGDYAVSDLGSSNGTFLNGRRLNGAEVVKAGDFVKFGILKVAVQEHTDTLPKIVSLRDRPAFARKDESNTASIAVERKTGSVATVAGGEASAETRATPTAPPVAPILNPIAMAVAAASPVNAELEKEVTSKQKEIEKLSREIRDGESRFAKISGELDQIRRELADRDEELRIASEKAGAGALVEKELKAREADLAKAKAEAEKFAAEVGAKAALEKELKAREAELAKSKAEAETKAAEIARLAAEVGEVRERFESSSFQAVGFEHELAELKAALARSTGETQEARKALADREEVLARREEAFATLSQEQAALRKTIEAKESDLAATTGELAKIAVLTASLAKLESDLAEARSRRDHAGAEGRMLAARLEDRESELEQQRQGVATLEAQVASLTAAEKDKSGLAVELAGAKARLAEMTVELKEAKTAIESERKTLAKVAKDGESEKTKLEKALATLEAKFQKQGEDQAALKLSLQEKDKELKAAAAEAKKQSQVAQEVETLRGALAAAVADSKILSDRLAERESAEEAARAEAARIAEDFERFRRESEEQSAAALAAARESDLDELHSRLEDQVAAISAMERQIADERHRSEVVAKERDEVRASLEALRKAGDGAAAELVDLRAKHESVLGERDELHAREKQQAIDLQAAKAEANELRLSMRKEKEAAGQSHRELETTLRARVAELETALASERVRAAETGSEKTRVEAALAAVQAELETMKEESSQLRVRSEEVSRNNGRLQAELHREMTERSQVNEALEASRVRVNGLVAELETLKHALEGKEREMAEREQQFTRSESETVQKIKRELSETVALRDAAEEKAARALKEKQTLGGAFERLKEQLDQTEAALRAAKESEEELNHGKGLLARRLEKAESSNNELAARIKEEAMAVIASRNLIEKLELQIRENESEAVAREREQVGALQADLSRASRRAAEDERRRRDLESELAKVNEARKQAEERLLALEARLVEQQAETESTRDLLQETEKSRIDLVSKLAGETSMVETHARTIEGLRRELAETITRFTSAETDLIARHGRESDALLTELRSERTHREGLEVELRNTREGLSEAVRKARENGEKALAKLLAEGNAKLSAVEEELGNAIRARESIEQSRSVLEDELNDREEEIETLSERIEDLEIRLQDEIESRHGVLRLLDTTRAGFSETLRAGWDRLGEAGDSLSRERACRRDAEDALLRARGEIDRLGADLEERERHHQAEIREWEDRYETLRGEKLTLASEDADLRKIRDEIIAATARKRVLEDEIESLGTGVKEIQSRQGELKSQRENLLAEREELKAALNAARLELGILQKRCQDSKDQEVKQSEAIAAAERRIQSLRKLESEMEHAVERRRQQHQLSRGDVFSDPGEVVPSAASDGFSQEDFYRKLIAKLDLIDDLAKRYDNKWLYPKVSEQLGILKRGFVDLLEDHSVQPFDLEPGTIVSISERKRIKLVPLQNGVAKKANGNGSQSSLVVETVRPGYVYRNGSRDVIIRKAEVVVS